MRDNPDLEYRVRINLDGETRTYRVNDVEYMGYYYAETQKEINSTIHRLNDMLTGVANARTGLMYAPLNEPIMTIEVKVTMNGGVA